jgi:hypothetical protein
MRPLLATDMLEISEIGLSRSLPARAVLLLARACPEESWESLSRLSIGERDRRLLTLRQWTFGNRLQALTNCPACQLPLGLEVDVDAPRAEQRATTCNEHRFSLGEYDVTFRLPNTEDLLAMIEDKEEDSGSLCFLERCVLEARCGTQSILAPELPSTIQDEITRRMEEADPQAVLQWDVACPSCGHSWRTPFDIVSFFWNEITTLARQLLFEVHAIASAYGWSEEEILRMSPWRREMYLEMVNG